MLSKSEINLQDAIESLERTINEIQALSIIYNDIDDAIDNDCTNVRTTTSFNILSNAEYELAQNLIEKEIISELQIDNVTIPSYLRVEINLNLLLEEGIESNQCCAKIHITLPRGYPTRGVSAVVSIASIDNLDSNRSQRDQFVESLNLKSKELAALDSEALMELIQYAQDNASNYLLPSKLVGPDCTIDNIIDGKTDDQEKSIPVTFSRRWIWVHHITNNDRCKDIVREARALKLSGYLKRGYPGIVVVEGNSSSCDEYVAWIKGNKSRPGGFGRNWGHHVRGEVMLKFENDSKDEQQSPTTTSFMNKFEDIGEDLADLAKACRQVGIEDEFKKYVMQH